MRNGTMELTLKIAGVPVEEFVHAKETCALLALLLLRTIIRPVMQHQLFHSPELGARARRPSSAPSLLHR